MENNRSVRIAWLIPSMTPGYYIQPVLREFTKRFPQTQVLTGKWPGFVPGCENTFNVEVVGKTKYIKLKKASAPGYGGGFALPPIGVFGRLFQSNYQLVFVNTFTLWTLFTLILKPLKRWKVVVIYSGSSPGADMQKLVLRRWMAPQIDGFITNSQGGKRYLTEILGIAEEKIFARPYQIPDQNALLGEGTPQEIEQIKLASRPVFLFVGRTTQRKGITYLLDACSRLKQQGYQYTLALVGSGREGEQHLELEQLINQYDLSDRILTVGWVNYGQLGYYLQESDVFVFPTLEDIWGMVVLEAMLFGKPILCSKLGGAYELIQEGENGYIFDPYQPEQLAEKMRLFIENPTLITKFGNKSQSLISPYNPESAAESLAKVVEFVLEKESR